MKRRRRRRERGSGGVITIVVVVVVGSAAAEVVGAAVDEGQLAGEDLPQSMTSASSGVSKNLCTGGSTTVSLALRFCSV